MNRQYAERFATRWIEAWNARDLDEVLSHYTDDFEMSSPMIAQILGVSTGALKGKSVIAAYWRKALTVLPELKFELISVLTSPRSVTLLYKGTRGRLVAEVFRFDDEGKVCSAVAHYSA